MVCCLADYILMGLMNKEQRLDYILMGLMNKEQRLDYILMGLMNKEQRLDYNLQFQQSVSKSVFWSVTPPCRSHRTERRDTH